MTSIVSEKVKTVLTYDSCRKQEDEEEMVETKEDIFGQLMDKVGRRLTIFTYIGALLTLIGFIVTILSEIQPDLFTFLESDVGDEEEESAAWDIVEYVWELWNLVLFLSLFASFIKKKFVASTVALKLFSLTSGFFLRVVPHVALLCGTLEGFSEVTQESALHYIPSNLLAYVWFTAILFLVAFFFEVFNLYGILSKKSRPLKWFTIFRTVFIVILGIQLTFSGLFTVVIPVIILFILGVELSVNKLIHDVVKFEEDIKKIKNENERI